MNIDILFCQHSLRVLRQEAKQKKVTLPARMTAIRCSGARPWFFVEATAMRGVEVEAQNAYQAKAIIIRKLIEHCMKNLTLKTTLVSLLQKGDRVIIYQDPITRKKPEGTARLVRRLAPLTAETNERWRVRFESDDFITDRFIAPSGNGAWEIIDDDRKAPSIHTSHLPPS